MITDTLLSSDYYNAQRLNRSGMIRDWCTGCGIAVVIGLALLGPRMKTLAFMLIFGGIGGVLGLLIQEYVFLPRKVRRVYEQRKAFHAPLMYSWDDEALKVETEGGFSETAWQDYLKYEEDENIMLLYLSEDLFQMLPKRWFRDTEQLEEFRVLAQGIGRS